MQRTIHCLTRSPDHLQFGILRDFRNRPGGYRDSPPFPPNSTKPSLKRRPSNLHAKSPRQSRKVLVLDAGVFLALHAPFWTAYLSRSGKRNRGVGDMRGDRCYRPSVRPPDTLPESSLFQQLGAFWASYSRTTRLAVSNLRTPSTPSVRPVFRKGMPGDSAPERVGLPAPGCSRFLDDLAARSNSRHSAAPISATIPTIESPAKPTRSDHPILLTANQVDEPCAIPRVGST